MQKTQWVRVCRRLWLVGTTLTVTGFYARALLRLRAAQAVPRLSTGSRVDEGSENESAAAPRVSVILPARNEEANVRGCVESLLAECYPNFEVIVVDDASDDATPAILAELAAHHPQRDRLRIVRLDTLPPGWAGKPHAIHAGASAATGTWLLLTDADTRHSADAIRITTQTARDRDTDLLSLDATQDMPDFWSRVLMPLAFLGVFMQYDVATVNDPNSSLAIANGQFILIKRAMYDRIGGYDRTDLRGTLVDDRDLAAAVKRAGGRLLLVPGEGLVHTRMYQSLREHWAGWGKNAYVGSRGGPLFYVLMIVGLPIMCIQPFAIVLAGIVARKPALLAAGATQVAALAVYRRSLNRNLGVPQWSTWTHPLAGAVFTGILAEALWARLRGQSVAWRGRSYDL